MLAMSDVDINQFLPFFSDLGISVAFLVPTPTGYHKSIMDAIGPVRSLLKDEGIHDYDCQEQGPEAKEMRKSFFVHNNGLEETEASLYRPRTKKGDPRIWFKGLRKYCNPCNLLALFVYRNAIFVMNLSSEEIQYSLDYGGFVTDLFQEIKYSKQSVAMELLALLRKIHRLGFIPSITRGDPGVGDTLEHALGIRRNNSRTPDYKGIELKATRLTRHGIARLATRSTLFTKVPDAGLSYREIVEVYGKCQTPKGSDVPRLQLYETLTTQRMNAYNLGLLLNNSKDRLEIIHDEVLKQYVSSWQFDNLRAALLLKHQETFWVKAQSIDRNGKEFFRYDKVVHTKKPNASLLAPLIESGRITVDLAAHFKEDGKWRDHGMLFKMMPRDLHLLLGETMEYDLASYSYNSDYDIPRLRVAEEVSQYGNNNGED